MQSFVQNLKSINLGPKLSNVGILSTNVQKTIFIFEMNTPTLVKMESFMQN